MKPGTSLPLVAALVIAGCAGDAATSGATEAALIERTRVSMGSELRLSAWAADEQQTVRAFEQAFDEFDRLDRLLSVWHAGSDVSRINAAAGRQAVPVSLETREVLKTALQVSELTGGKFDVTFGALSGLWKFDHDQDNHIPSLTEVQARLPLVDYRGLRLDEGGGTAFLERQGMRVHLGGIGKGYAVDRAAAILRGAGIVNFLIQSGGDLYAAGRRGERDWRAAIRDPRGEQEQIFAAMNLHDETFSTSGDYERFFMQHGRRYHHILDPDQGQPAAGCRSVTIVAKRAVLADALSTGVFVLGPDQGMTLIESLADVEGVIVTAHNEVRVSSGLTARLERLHHPTDAP